NETTRGREFIGTAVGDGGNDLLGRFRVTCSLNQSLTQMATCSLGGAVGIWQQPGIPIERSRRHHPAGNRSTTILSPARRITSESAVAQRRRARPATSHAKAPARRTQATIAS